MGQHTFQWPYPANEVYVTGTFDDWQRTVRLNKDDKSGAFIATIELDLHDADKVFYKFVVDGNWTVLNAARTELDTSGIENNVLLKDDMSTPVGDTPETNAPANTAAQALISSASPDSTTASLAANVPLVKDEQPAEIPTPALDDVPGGFPETPAAASVNNPVEEQTFSINPMPATTTPGNPINLQPGQPIPDISSQTVEDTVHLDKEHYERADASNLGVGDYLPPVVTPAEEREAKGRGVLDIPEITSNLIPESSLPIIGSDEKKEVAEVPEVVKQSQEQAGVEPKASAYPETVEAKKEVEQEIEKVVPEAPVTAEGGGYLGAANDYAAKAKDATVAATATASEQVGAAAATVKDTVSSLIFEHKEAQPVEQNAVANVPEVVIESQEAAHFPPEASANPEAVEQKAKVEDEIVNQPPELHATVPIESHVPVAPQTLIEIPAGNVPKVVKESIQQAHAPPEAAADPVEVAFKGVLEHELKNKVPEAKSSEETQPKTVAANTIPSTAVASIRKVEPEDSESPRVSYPLSTSPVASTTQTFTQHISGTTINGNAAKDAPTAKAMENADSENAPNFTEKDVNGTAPIVPSKSNGTSSNPEKKVKRRSYIISKIKSIFKDHKTVLAIAFVSFAILGYRSSDLN